MMDGVGWKYVISTDKSGNVDVKIKEGLHSFMDFTPGKPSDWLVVLIAGNPAPHIDE